MRPTCVLTVASRRSREPGRAAARCLSRTSSIDPDTGTQDFDVSRPIRHGFGNQLALNCRVIRPGAVHLGDTATLRPAHEGPADRGAGS